ncbi:integrase [Xanthobacter sp. VTT E-85241]|uniref:integrase n=1 Tax=Roseixanthobacter finlandensis TaxID=3119922 RepID=UPI00372783A5
MTGDDSAPGLKRMKRKSGRTDVYWVANETHAKAGYEPKTVRLHGDWDDPAARDQIAARCRKLQQEMLEWAAGFLPDRRFGAAGTIAWLCDAFQTDLDSPYRDTRPSTQRFYDDNIKFVRATVGEVLVRDVTGRDIRRWHKNWGRWDEKAKTMANPRRGYGGIQTLRRVVSYGCEMKDRACLELAQVLAEMEFSSPRRRQVRPTYGQIIAFRTAARGGDFKRPSMARAIVLQFELALRQKDVIGEWLVADDGSKVGIMDAGSRWANGVLWGDHIDKDWVLRKPTSKSNFDEVAVHDLKLHPDVLAEFEDVKREERIGPVIINEHTGKPYRRREFARVFRSIARAAGWPDDLWNRDTKAGAVSEAFEAGSEAADVMKVATHTQMSTTMLYNRGAIEQTSRVAKLRVAGRNTPGTKGGNTGGNTSS